MPSPAVGRWNPTSAPATTKKGHPTTTPPPNSASQTFTTTVEDAGRGRVGLALPFDPDEVWGTKPRHHVGGTVGECKVRGTIDPGRRELLLGAMWVRDASIAVGETVKVVLLPEGPQASDLADDLRDALDADPKAKAYFDGLAQFYRKGYVRYIEATKRKPELRAERIAEVVALCREGRKERP